MATRRRSIPLTPDEDSLLRKLYRINRIPSDQYRRLYHYFELNRGEFLTHYHQRSNVESTFSMVKRKFGDSLRSKTPTALTNEALAKLLCHNVVVLVHEMHELGIAAQFGTAGPDEPADDTPAIIRFPGA